MFSHFSEHADFLETASFAQNRLPQQQPRNLSQI